MINEILQWVVLLYLVYIAVKLSSNMINVRRSFKMVYHMLRDENKSKNNESKNKS